MDLNHAVPFSTPCGIWAGGYEDCAGAAVVVLTAGADRSPARHDSTLPAATGPFLRMWCPGLRPSPATQSSSLPQIRSTCSRMPRGNCRACRRNASSAQAPSSTPRASGFSSAGTSTWTRSVHAYVIGEHGDSECWCGRLPTSRACGCRTSAPRTISDSDEAAMDGIGDDTRRAAYHIIERKGDAVLRGGGGPAAHPRGHPSRSGHRALGVQSRPVTLRNARRVPEPFHGGHPHGIERVLHLPLTTRRRRRSAVWRGRAQDDREPAPALPVSGRPLTPPVPEPSTRVSTSA